MRKSLFSLLAFALLASSCSLHDKLYIDLPGTAWEYVSGNVTTWVSFHDDSHASIMQYNASNKRQQVDHGTYTCDGHLVVITPSRAQQYSLVRTYSNLKHFSDNHNFTKLRTWSYPTLETTIWASTDTNDFHILYLKEEGVAVDVVYNNITREEDMYYGWKAAKSTYIHSSDKMDAGGATALLYKDFFSTDKYSLMFCTGTENEEEGGSTSTLKGTVWAYNNTGYPADAPYVIIFNGNKTFTRLFANSAISYTVESGTYSEEGGTVSFELDDKKGSCPISGSSFTLWERTYKKLDY